MRSTCRWCPVRAVAVRRILFKGNSRTSDEVLRREMRQFEDTWYSQAAIDRSKIRLQRLGYFESVDVETPAVPGSNDQVDVVFNVKETTSGSFVFGLGYSQSYGITTSVQLSQNNFLGGGNRVSVEASRSGYCSAMASATPTRSSPTTAFRWATTCPGANWTTPTTTPRSTTVPTVRRR